MAYERLTQLLSKAEKHPVEIAEAFVFKFGALLLAEELPSDDDPYQFTAQERLREGPWEPPNQMFQEIRAAIESHPNVFHVLETDPSHPSMSAGTRTGALADGPVFKMDIQLPKRRQHFQDGDACENFTVLWAGSYFAAYAPIEEIPVYTNIAHEFRELARAQILQSTGYKAPLFGPCPTSNDVIVAFTREVIPQTTPTIRSYERGGDLYVLVGEAGPPREEAMRDLFYLARRCWSGYYELMLARSDSVDLDAEVQNRFNAASETVNLLATTRAWRIWKASKVATAAALEIGAMHGLLLKYDDACWYYDRERRDYLKGLLEIPHFSKLRRSMAEATDRDFKPQPRIGAALEFLDKQIELTRNIRSLTLASLFGAIVGSLITGLLALLKR